MPLARRRYLSISVAVTAPTDQGSLDRDPTGVLHRTADRDEAPVRRRRCLAEVDRIPIGAPAHGAAVLTEPTRMPYPAAE